MSAQMTWTAERVIVAGNVTQRLSNILSGFLPLSMQTGFPWSHCPSIPHLSVSAPSSQYPVLQMYFRVDMQVKGPLPSICPFSNGPGSLQC